MPMKVLIIIDKPPYGDWSGREALDMAFSLAAFDQPVSLLFLGGGVNWLRPGQNAEAIEQKTVTRQLGAAAVFGIEEFLVESQGLRVCGMAADALSADVICVEPGPNLYRQYQHIVCL